MIYLYAISSIALEDGLEKAENILYDLYYNKGYDIAFESLVRCYFLQKKYDKVLELLSKAKKDKFDRYGFLASIFIISKNFTKIKEQFKNGLKYLKTEDVIAINTMCNVAMDIKLNEEMIKFLLNIDLTPYLKIRLAKFLINKSNLNEKEIDKLKEIKEQIDEQDIDVDYIEGILLENQGKEIKAISKYEQSYNKKGTINSAYKYIELSRNNFCDIKDELLKELSFLQGNLNILQKYYKLT